MMDADAQYKRDVSDDRLAAEGAGGCGDFEFSSAMSCPKCAKPLAEAVYEGVAVQWCAHCQGAFVGKDDMDLFLRSRREGMDFAPAAPDDVGHVSSCAAPGCAGCFRTLRVRAEYPLAVDVCETCGGFWFDAGEMEHADDLARALEAKKEIDKDFRWFHGLFLFLTSSIVEFNIKAKKRPVLVYALLVLNSALSVALWAFYPDFDPLFVPGEPFGPHWAATLFSSFFVQADIVHLLGNMYFLYVFGDNVEDALGGKNFLIFYLAAGAFSGIVHALLTSTPDIPYLGASGAVSALMAAYCVYFHFAKISLPIPIFWIWKKTRKISCGYVIGVFIAFDVVGAFFTENSSGVAYWAHVGGALFGFVWAKATLAKVLKRNGVLNVLHTLAKARA